MHAAVPLARAHTAPHVPQLAIETRPSTSHPFARLRSQSRNPAAHAVYPHAPAAHCAVALPGVHPIPHAPQFVRLDRVSTSQPLVGSRSQSPKPAAHIENEHTPAAQRPTALAGEHTRPQPPQCVALERVSTSQPFTGFASQSAKPGIQALMRHTPAAHSGTALGRAHARLHAPQ